MSGTIRIRLTAGFCGQPKLTPSDIPTELVETGRIGRLRRGGMPFDVARIFMAIDAIGEV